MEPTIVESQKMILVGFSFYGDPLESNAGWTEDNEIGRLWKRFERHMAQNAYSLMNLVNTDVAYEVHVYGEDTLEKGQFEVFVGMQVEQLEKIPIEMVAKILPASTFAVLQLRGEEINSDWSRRISSEWLPRSPYREMLGFIVQRYDERFKGVDHLDESVLEVYIPVK